MGDFNMSIITNDIEKQVEKLKELIEKDALREDIKAEQLKLNQMLEKYLEDTK